MKITFEIEIPDILAASREMSTAIAYAKVMGNLKPGEPFKLRVDTDYKEAALTNLIDLYTDQAATDLATLNQL